MNLLKKSLVLGALVVLMASCSSNDSPSGDNGDGDSTMEADGGPGTPTTDEWDDKLAERVIDYNAALRKAALRLTGDLPTLAEIHTVADAASDSAKKAAYESLVADYLERPSFARQAFMWWKDTLKLGDDPLFDQAAAFAAQVTFENRSYMELLTATSGQCGSFDEQAGTFTAGDCTNGVPAQAGLLTHPGAMKQYFSNLAFRRVRWVQETFDCTKFPVEISDAPEDVGGLSPYTGVWPFDSISGLETGRIDFLDTAAVICANCHSTMNHIAPLFAHFDENGQYSDSIAVPTPLEGSPLAELTDYLPAGQTLAWRYGGMETPDLASLGQAMAADPAVAECAIARVWNWALDKGDIVDALRQVPSDIIADQVADFTANGFKLKDAVYAVFTSDDFVKF